MFYEGSYNVVNYRISRICPIISKFLNWKYKWRCSRILPSLLLKDAVKEKTKQRKLYKRRGKGVVV